MFWYVVNMCLVFVIAVLVELKVEATFSYFELAEIKIIAEKEAFDMVIWSIFISGWMSIILFFTQIRNETEATMFDSRISKEITQVMTETPPINSLFQENLDSLTRGNIPPVCLQCKVHVYVQINE